MNHHVRPVGAPRPRTVDAGPLSSLRRTAGRVVSDLVPRLLGRLGIHLPTPRGRIRPREEDVSMAVPFGFEVPVDAGRPPIAVVCHIFHADLAGALFDLVSHIEVPCDLYVSTDTPEKKDEIGRVFARWERGRVDIRVVENRGRDIAPKLVAFADVYPRHEIVLFLHSKKSPHLSFGEAWRDHLTSCIVGSPAVVASILAVFDRRPDVGMVIPQHFPPFRDREWINWGDNFLRSRRLAWRMGFDLAGGGVIDFPSGSMFWARSAALHPLLALGLGSNDFPEERGQIDMTVAHCIERCFLHVCERAGFTWVKVSGGDRPDHTARPIAGLDEVDAFVERFRFDLLGPA